jgi:hypothetical protein
MLSHRKAVSRCAQPGRVKKINIEKINFLITFEE